MPERSEIDLRYYRALESGGSLAQLLFASARRRIYADFIRLCRPESAATILDVGVTDFLNAASNIIENSYPYRHNITATGLSDGGDFKREFPEVTYVQVAGDGLLPFPDKMFDFAVSNAVLEHVGSRAAQHALVQEMCRVAYECFISVPNRYFPVEHHTALPLVHFSDATFGLACRLFGLDWHEESNLILMSRSVLRDLGPVAARVGYAGIKLGPFSSNLFLHIRALKAPRD